jgi:hypothetical protein
VPDKLRLTLKIYTFFYKKTVTCTFLLLTIASISFAQGSLQDSILNVETTNNIVTLYQDAMKGNLRLYNGNEYLFSGHNTKGFPYFKSADKLNGSVYYDNNLYDNVSMYYDLVKDELVINDYTKNFPIKLITDKIKYFVIDGNKFINSNLDNGFPIAAAKGFYEELYHNKTIAFAKKLKVVTVKTSTEGSEFSYREFDYYFLYYNNNVYKVTNEKSILDVFKKRKQELRKFINTNKINFKKNFEEALVSTTQYFDQLEN